jgi:hypothetical protein
MRRALRPNGRSNTVHQRPAQGGGNGNHAPAPGTQPEFAAGRVSAGLSFSALRTTAKPHARLVIEKGRSTGKQFMLSDVEAQIGRWDADGGIFPMSISIRTTRKRRFRVDMPASLSVTASIFSRISDRQTVRSSIVARDYPQGSVRHYAMATRSSSGKHFCASTS